MNPKALTLLIASALACPMLQAQSPGGVSANLSLWVKAESTTPKNGGALTGWTEQTAHNRFSLSGTTMSVVTNVINFHPIVRFNAKGKLIGNSPITWSECTAVASWTGATTTERGTVISPTTNGSQTNDDSRYYFRSGVESNPGNFLFSGMGSDSIGFVYVKSPAATQVNVYTSSGVGDVFTQNGIDATVGTLFGGFSTRGVTMSGIPQIGNRSTNDAPMIGDIAEIIVYSANNAAGRNKVESYLALKYGLTLGNTTTPVNYTSSTGNAFWTGSTVYQNNVFGIGSDNGSGLAQTSSNSMNTGSGSGTGQSAQGNLVLATSAALADQLFLMIGSDAAPLTQETITAQTGPTVAVSSTRLVRTWKVQNTGSVGAVSLSFDKTGLTLSGGNTAGNYFLMVDNDGDGNFTTGSQTFIPAASISGQLVNFSPVTLANNIVFTLITFAESMLPLALDWQTFTATRSQNTTRLQWTVTGDDPIDHFDVQRSSDGSPFTTIGATTACQYNDPLSAGTWLYRVAAVDINGQILYSPIRSIQATGQPSVQIRPNPIQGNQLRLQIDALPPSIYTLHIVDNGGRLLLQRQVTISAGVGQITIDLPPLPAGLYFVQLKSIAMNGVLSFVKY